MKENTKPNLLTCAQLAKALSVSERTIRTWTANRKISVIAITARCHRYHLPTVLADLKLFQIPALGRKIL